MTKMDLGPGEQYRLDDKLYVVYTWRAGDNGRERVGVYDDAEQAQMQAWCIEHYGDGTERALAVEYEFAKDLPRVEFKKVIRAR